MGIPIEILCKKWDLPREYIERAIENGKKLNGLDENLHEVIRRWNINTNDKIESIYPHLYSVNEDKILKFTKSEWILLKDIEIANSIRNNLIEYEVPYYEKNSNGQFICDNSVLMKK